MKKNKKGFTLIELLAVIVILGLLMAIAIPSVTRYITQSRRKTVVTSINSYVTSVLNQVNDGEYKFSDSTKIYAVPIECIPLEKGGTNPFGNWLQANEAYWAYVLVQYDNENYNYTYGFTFKDDAGYGMYPTSHANIEESGSQVKTGYNDLNKPNTGLAIEFVPIEKWTGFNVTTSTDLVVLEAESEGKAGNGETTCTLCQKGDNYEQVESDKNNNTLSSLIMKHNSVITAAPTLTTSSNNTSDASGLYSSTTTNSGNPTYYFRGNVTNNYVSFAGQTWRIVRINEDGTVRLILNGNADSTKYVFGSKYFMHYSNSSIIKTNNNWYETSILNEGYDSYVATSSFCQEGKILPSSAYTSDNTTLIKDYIPNFKCEKLVENIKVGLITYDEVMYAGGYSSKDNPNYYLYTGSEYWTISPYGMYSGSVGVEFIITSSGAVGTYQTQFAAGYLRPVINLNVDVEATGTGIETDPYVVLTN